MQSLERRLERMVEGVFRRSRNTIRPIELGRRLIREMDDHRTVDVRGERIVPNDFVVLLSANDHAGFADIEDALRTELVEASRKKTPMKRLGTAGEVAELIVYLASDAAHFVTGECWYIDGGAHLWGDNWLIPDDEPPAPPAIVAELGE